MVTTLENIARKAGVSVPVVSKVLHGGRTNVGVSPRTSQRVRRIAVQLGYRPNSAARAMYTRRFNTVGLVMSPVQTRSHLPHDLLAGLNEALGQREQHLIVSMLPDEKLASSDFTPRLLRELTCDGVLLNYFAHVPTELVKLVEHCHLPVVWINAKRALDAVYPDDFSAGHQATRILLERGHRRILYADDSFGRALELEEQHYSKVDRLGGYKAAMAEAGLEPASVLAHDYTQLERELTRLFSTPARPTAVIGYGAREVASTRYVGERVGLCVPRDLSLVGFSDEPVAVGSLTGATMILPERQLGRAAVEMLLQRIESPRGRQAARALPFGFTEGETVAPPALPEARTGAGLRTTSNRKPVAAWQANPQRAEPDLTRERDRR